MNDFLEYYREYRPMMNTAETRELFADISFDQLLGEWRSLTDQEAADIFLHLNPEVKLDLITELEAEDQEKVIRSLSAQGKKTLFQEMEPDDLVDIVQSVSQEIRRTVWESLDDETKRETLFLLRFDEDDAAGLMTPRYLAVRSDISVGQALAFIRANSDKVELLSDIYVLDELQRLDGVISVKDILSAADGERVSSIMNSKVVSVLDTTDQEDVAKTLETHDMVSLPVVDAENLLLGVITFDDVMDVIREEETEDVYRMGAMSGDAEAYMNSSIWRLVKKRVPWLIILLLVGTITTNVLHHYESLIIGAAFLFIFMPVITQTGGNSGSQSATLMIRGLATGEIEFRDIGMIVLRELLVGILMGIITGLVIVLRSFFLPPGIALDAAFAVGVSLAFVVFVSNLIGTLAPLLIHKMGFDPTVMSAPLMATVIDVAGITIYFETARLLLGF
jgi:magnesium transporter